MPRQAAASLPVNLRPELFCVFDVLLDEGKDRSGVLRGTAEELFHWKGWDLMSKTRILGIVLMVLGVLLLSGAVYQVYVNMAHVGPVAGKISSYLPPFPNHGLYVVIAGAASVVSFLGGALMCALGRS